MADTATQPNDTPSHDRERAHTRGRDSVREGHSADASPNRRPSVPHTVTQSTLAPTSEWVRYLLLFLPARYSFRSQIDGIFGKDVTQKFAAWRDGLIDKFLPSKPNESTDARSVRHERAGKYAYDYALGLGSLWLTTSYTSLVKHDIKNIFCETVGMEMGKPAEQVTLSDIANSDNEIAARTMKNFKWKCIQRYGADLLFFTRPLLRRILPFTPEVGDMMVGVKAVQALAETWKRKTTMFEDLVTFVNNKINPRNGLGQPIGVGEVFDLYQHYAEGYQPNKMFRHVLENGSGEGAIWAKSQPIFQRMADLMNKTYAYKHTSIIDPETGNAVHQAEFALPKFIYLLGHRLIDSHQPDRTLAYIELINARGVDAVKQAQAMFAQGESAEKVVEKFGLSLPTLPDARPDAGPNGVIAKGSTMQLERANTPVTKIDAASIAAAPRDAQLQVAAAL